MANAALMTFDTGEETTSEGENRAVRLAQYPPATRTLCFAVAIFLATTAVVWAGAAFGTDLVRLCEGHPDARTAAQASMFERMAAWDGVWYRRIAEEGYSYDPSRMSSVAFYPMYPSVGAAVARSTGTSSTAALLFVSHSFLLGTFVLLAFYLRDRADGLGMDGAAWTLLAFGLFPTSFYFRMTYSESCFTFFIVLAMCGIRWRWPLILIALTIGAATATRSLGVAAMAPFLWHLWRIAPTPSVFFAHACTYLPLCTWGIVAYMAYQSYAFGDAFAFTQTMTHWYERQPPSGVWNKLWAWGTLEAYRDVYDPNCQCYWGNVAPRESPLFNLKFLNPMFALFAWGTVAWGYWTKRITIPESLLCLGLLGIPYFTHAYWACASSEARYASVVFPVYIVLGHALKGAPPALGGSLAALSGAALFAFTSLFTAWYWFY